MDTDVGHIGDKKDVTIESKEQYDTYFFSKVKTTLFVKKMLLWPKKSWKLIEDIIKNKETIIKLCSLSTEIQLNKNTTPYLKRLFHKRVWPRL